MKICYNARDFSKALPNYEENQTEKAIRETSLIYREDMMKQDVKQGLGFLGLSFLAFCGLGLEILLALGLEPLIYGAEMNEWNVAQSIFHWTLTCVVWILVVVLLLILSKKKMGFDPLSEKGPLKLLPTIVAVLLFAFMLVISYLDWNGLKVIKEFQYNGLAKFVFQYLYYIVETCLVVLVIVFSQRAGELWFKNKLIPYGGIFVALTWGLVHTLTKGDLITGIIAAIGGLIFGVMYLLLGKDLRKAFPIICLAFIL